MLESAKPAWLRISLPAGQSHLFTMARLKKNALCTVCVEARCPNQLECFNNGTATFMLLGPGCTRSCTFCAVDKRHIAPPNPEEPEAFAEAIEQMELNYCVLTMVTRDDLTDGGAFHIQKVVSAIRKHLPAIRIELLISDLGGDQKALESVVETLPDVLNHNIETVKRLYPSIRPEDYRREAYKMGFLGVASGPLVRSSYQAEKLYHHATTPYKLSTGSISLGQSVR